MGLLPIVPKESESTRNRCYLKRELLPAFYMEDFSVMGLSVGELDAAVSTLQRNGIEIDSEKTLAMAHIDGLGGMKTVLDILRGNGIAFELTDIADQIYQG
jgi:hypothetical protein